MDGALVLKGIRRWRGGRGLGTARPDGALILKGLRVEVLRHLLTGPSPDSALIVKELITVIQDLHESLEA